MGKLEDSMEDRKDLYELHGYVDVPRAISSLRFLTDEDIDIDDLNKASEEGVIYLNEKGVPMPGTLEEVDRTAQYKVIPTCYNNKYNHKQICASFIKSNNSWEGVFINTIDELIKRVQANYGGHYGKITKNDKIAVQAYSNNFIIKGYSLEEIVKYNEKLRGLSGDIRNEIVIDEETVNKIKAMAIENGTYDYNEKEDINDIKCKPIDYCDEDDIDEEEKTLYDNIYDMLLVKESWKSTDKNRLRFYIKSMMEKVAYEQSKDESLVGNGYILSGSKKKCVFNTGLIDIYNNDIYILDSSNDEKRFGSKILSIVESKASLVGSGFAREHLINMPRPIKFYDNKSSLVLDASIDDIDLSDGARLNHIIKERIDRFPDKYRDMPIDVISGMIKTAIDKAIQQSDRDYKYIVPMYNIKMNKIQYLAPLYLESSISDVPELAVVIGSNSGFYYVYTVLSIDTAYDNARLICKPSDSWLKVK